MSKKWSTFLSSTLQQKNNSGSSPPCWALQSRTRNWCQYWLIRLLNPNVFGQRTLLRCRPLSYCRSGFEVFSLLKDPRETNFTWRLPDFESFVKCKFPTSKLLLLQRKFGYSRQRWPFNDLRNIKWTGGWSESKWGPTIFTVQKVICSK